MKKLIKLFCVVALTLIANVSWAQQTSVTGRVTDESGLGVPGATVLEKGTANGTIADADGYFSLEAESGATIVFSFVGMAPQEVVFSGQTPMNVTLVAAAVGLDEVVVTALGIEREKKALGYSVQDVKAEALTATGNPNISSALEGKVAGVKITQSGTGVGGSSRIEIRGASSLSDNNRPLWIIDGIPFDDTQDGTAGIWGGVERAGAAFDINPSDIESVSVLKGPNAAALYGSRAGNGVIVITTKSGARGAGLGINYSGAVTVSDAAYFLNYQDQYGQGSGGAYDKNSTVSWGPKFAGQSLESWTGETIPYEAQTDRIKDFSRRGVSQNHNFSFTGGNDNGSFRASIGKDITNGIYEGHKVEKLNFDSKAEYDVNKWLNIDTKFSYILTEGDERPQMGYYSMSSYYNAMPMNIRNADLSPGYDIVGGRHVEKLYTTSNANYRNPYFLLEQRSNNDKRYRTFGYLAANIKFTPALKLRLKYGLDYYRTGIEDMLLYQDNVAPNGTPYYNTSEGFFKEDNAEFLLSYNKKAGDFDIGVNFGGNRMTRNSENLWAGSGLLPDEGYYFLGYGTNVTARESFVGQEVQSLYGFAQVGFRSMLYLDLTARNDWSSTLPVENSSYFYPSVGLSGIISEMVDMPSWFNFAKVRASWAQVGKATDPYSTTEVYTVSSFNFNLLNGNVPNTKVNEDLKPEISSSVEFGFDVRFLEGRIGLDFTYYDEKTKNQILQIATDQSTGYSFKLINAGLISNKGIEIMLNTTPVRRQDFNMDLNFNFARNNTLIEELDDELKEFAFGGLNNGVGVYGIEGERMGDIKGRTYKKDDSGNIIVGADGLPVKEEGNSVIGNIQADFTASAFLGLNYKGIFLNALVSMQQGGDIFSSTEQGAVGSGTAERTTAMDRISFFVDGVTEDGEINNTMVSAQEYWGAVSGIDEEFIYDASYMKLTELAIGYSIPQAILGRNPKNPIRSLRISLVGRNLLYFYKHTPGTIPDGSAYSSSYAAQAFDFTPVPSTRTLGFSLNVGF